MTIATTTRRDAPDPIAAALKRANPLGQVICSVGGFFATTAETARFALRRPFYWREFFDQAWFIASVSLLPAIFVSFPFCVIVIFELNQVLGEIGAIDLAGAAAGLAVVREIGPMVSVLVVAGAGATAMCADLGSRKVREEIDAMMVLGINPVHRLVVPRVAASMLVAVLLNGIVTIVGLVGGYFFTVYLQGGTPGLYVSSLTILVGLPDFIASCLKAAVFGLLAGLVGCHLGINAKGGPKGVGDAVNQTVVFSFILLFFANTIITSAFLQVTK